METKAILAAIRRQTNTILEIAPPDPELQELNGLVRVLQLKAMLELISSMTDAGLEVPAILDGGIRSEIDRLGGVK